MHSFQPAPLVFLSSIPYTWYSVLHTCLEMMKFLGPKAGAALSLWKSSAFSASKCSGPPNRPSTRFRVVLVISVTKSTRYQVTETR